MLSGVISAIGVVSHCVIRTAMNYDITDSAVLVNYIAEFAYGKESFLCFLREM